MADFEQCFNFALCNQRTDQQIRCPRCERNTYLCRPCFDTGHDHHCGCGYHFVPEELATDADLHSSIAGASTTEPSTTVQTISGIQSGSVSMQGYVQLVAAASDDRATDLDSVEEGNPLSRIAQLELEVDRLRNRAPEMQNDHISGTLLPSSLPIAHAEIIELRRKLDLQQHTINELQQKIMELQRFSNPSWSSPCHDLRIDASASGSSLGSSWAIEDSGEPPVVLIWWRGARVVCIQCDNPKNGLFTNSWQLVGEIVGQVKEEVNFNDDEIWKELAGAGQVWQGQNILRIEAASGEYHGLQAIGVGGKREKRERGARLALAATAAKDWESQKGYTPNPNGDGSFKQLARRVKQLFATSQEHI